MSWRTIVISSSSKLDYQMGFMVVRNEEITRIHIDEIAVLLLESTAVSLTGALLSELVRKKVKVVFCDEKRNPSSELIPYYGAHDVSMKIRKQVAWDEAIKEEIWTELVAEKIRNQAVHLEERNLPEAAMLHQYIKEMQLGDTTNREGHAAKVYFNALFGKEFSRSEETSINAALNYGYSIILSVFNREIVSNGYLTQIGLFHDNMFNPFNLGSDLMEPFRILVDRKVIGMAPDIFQHDEKMEILRLLQQEVYIGARKEVLLNAIKIYTKSVFDAINERDVSLIKFYHHGI